MMVDKNFMDLGPSLLKIVAYLYIHNMSKSWYLCIEILKKVQKVK